MLIEVINGLLGAGKTTFLLNLLEQKTGDEKFAVLVNEFGEIGIDGDLLGDQGADVVELPNGCICCTLTSDLRNQIKSIAETYHPDRLLIEPTGVATIKNLMNILRSLSLEKYIDDIRIIVVIDASMFRELLAQNRGFVETQIEMAEVIVINKCDKVDQQEIGKLLDIIKNVNNSGQVLLTSFGRILDTGITIEEALVQKAGHGQDDHRHHHDDHHDHDGDGHNHELPLKKYEQFSGTSTGVFDEGKLRDLFSKIKNEHFGPVDRAKGLFLVSGDRWVRFDLASRDVNEVPLDRVFRSSKIMVIGTELQKRSLKAEFRKCLVKNK
ncbi:MAG: CobW family GTP-binding protein [Eubacteriales bacterium]